MLEFIFLLKTVNFSKMFWNQYYFSSEDETILLEIRQSKISSRSVDGPMGQMNRRPSV